MQDSVGGWAITSSQRNRGCVEAVVRRCRDRKGSGAPTDTTPVAYKHPHTHTDTQTHRHTLEQSLAHQYFLCAHSSQSFLQWVRYSGQWTVSRRRWLPGWAGKSAVSMPPLALRLGPGGHCPKPQHRWGAAWPTPHIVWELNLGVWSDWDIGVSHRSIETCIYHLRGLGFRMDCSRGKNNI